MNNSQQSYTLPDGEGRGGAIVFATNNKHKLSEIRAILGDRFHVLSLEDINCHADIPETANTLEGNAIQKARYVVDNYGYDCFGARSARAWRRTGRPLGTLRRRHRPQL